MKTGVVTREERFTALIARRGSDVIFEGDEANDGESVILRPSLFVVFGDAAD